MEEAHYPAAEAATAAADISDTGDVAAIAEEDLALAAQLMAAEHNKNAVVAATADERGLLRALEALESEIFGGATTKATDAHSALMTVVRATQQLGDEIGVLEVQEALERPRSTYAGGPLLLPPHIASLTVRELKMELGRARSKIAFWIQEKRELSLQLAQLESEEEVEGGGSYVKRISSARRSAPVNAAAGADADASDGAGCDSVTIAKLDAEIERFQAACDTLSKLLAVPLPLAPMGKEGRMAS